MSKDDHFPTVLPGGGLMPHMTARRRSEVCDIVFEQLGGPERLHHEANRDRDSYWEFMRMWAKGLPRASTTEHTVNENDVEKLLEKLDNAANARTINGDFSEVEEP